MAENFRSDRPAVDERAEAQAQQFAARLSKLARHLRRLPSKQGITCFRLYERDIPEVPLVVDRYEDHLHLSEYDRPSQRDPAAHDAWLDLMAKTAGETLGVPPEKVFLKRRRRQVGTTQHEQVAQQRYEIEVREGGLKFIVNLSDYIDTGLFLDHRITRSMVRDTAAGKRFLNLFAYTGAFSVYAADGGASEVVTVDWSNTYLNWARRNMQLNGFESSQSRSDKGADPLRRGQKPNAIDSLPKGQTPFPIGSQYTFTRSDAVSFVDQLPEQPLFDLAVVDPPTFSNSKRSERHWDVQRDSVPLLGSLLRRMSAGGVIFYSNNFRGFKMEPNELPAADVHEISNQSVPPNYRNRKIHRCWRIVK